MNMAIWKYPLAITDLQSVMMPVGAEILTVQMQGSQLCLWAKVNTVAVPKARRIEIAGTGHPIPDVGRRYISTVQQLGGSLIWHVFELTN